MDYKYGYIVNSDGFYKDFAVVWLATNADGIATQSIEGYTLLEGETIVDIPPFDMLKARWTGTTWKETATPEEIAAAEAERAAMSSH